MERYQIKTNKDSGILNDPNQYSPIAKNPTQDNFELDKTRPEVYPHPIKKSHHCQRPVCTPYRKTSPFGLRKL